MRMTGKMNDEQKAKEILDYCIDYLRDGEFGFDKKEEKLYKEMIKEIKFMLTTD